MNAQSIFSYSSGHVNLSTHETQKTVFNLDSLLISDANLDQLLLNTLKYILIPEDTPSNYIIKFKQRDYNLNNFHERLEVFKILIYEHPHILLLNYNESATILTQIQEDSIFHPFYNIAYGYLNSVTLFPNQTQHIEIEYNGEKEMEKEMEKEREPPVVFPKNEGYFEEREFKKMYSQIILGLYDLNALRKVHTQLAYTVRSNQWRLEVVDELIEGLFRDYKSQ